jgi:hypothetical protein
LARTSWAGGGTDPIEVRASRSSCPASSWPITGTTTVSVMRVRGALAAVAALFTIVVGLNCFAI